MHKEVATIAKLSSNMAKKLQTEMAETNSEVAEEIKYIKE